MYDDRLSRTVGETVEADSVEDIHRICSRLCELYDFDHFIYAARFPDSLVNPFRIVISGYPNDWLTCYNENHYLRIDPTVAHSARAIRPLLWEELNAVEKSNPEIHHFMNEARNFGLCSGLTVPLHGAHGEAALLSLTSSSDPKRHREQINLATPEVVLLSTYIHEAACRIVKHSMIDSEKIELSCRERDCLLWSAEGKTSWEISQILGISERTVIYHLQRVVEKLGVTSRQQAIARAISQGLITPQID
ncbi:MAG: LuxR family transcriptional regulator [Pseudomonadota bacterium]|nr:LuxR family transcriptional regulator [Pseudomonadota bacterium]